MSTPITFPPFAPKLKLARRTPESHPADAAVAESQAPFQSDAASQSEQTKLEQGDLPASNAVSQSSTQGFAGRVRLTESADSMAPFYRPGGSSTAPAQGDFGLQNGWDQLKRARALLEAEQKDLRDQRLSLRELEGQVARREMMLKAREQAMEEREAAFRAAQVPAKEEGSPSAVTRLTRAPFEIARSVFGAGSK